MQYPIANSTAHYRAQPGLSVPFTKSASLRIIQLLITLFLCSCANGPKINAHPNDNRLKNSISKAIKKASPALKKNSHVNVNVYKSIVLLTGEVPTYLAKKQAEQAALKVGGASSIHNEIVVGPITPLISRSKDSWNRGKIESKLNNLPGIAHSLVKVVVENNVVFLIGKVSRKEAQKITEASRKTRGIGSVVRVFSYVD